MRPKNKKTTTSIDENPLPKLLPWIVSIIVYFSRYPNSNAEDQTYLIIKLLPMLSLLLFLYQIGGLKSTENRAYSKRIFFGLLFSTIGDGFLVYQKYLLQGMASFAIAHLLYISGFGLKPLKLQLGLIIYAFAGLSSFAYFKIINDVLMKFGVSIYTFLLFTMAWRSLSRFRKFNKISLRTHQSEICSVLGAVLFIISDKILAYQLFVHDFPYAIFLNITTYYGAQLFMALSVLNTLNDEKINNNVCCLCCNSSNTENKKKSN